MHNAQVFENHAPAQRLLLALGVITTMEAVPMHFLLRAYHPVVAWIVLGLTLYSLYWMIAQARTLAARPHLLSAEKLLLRVGSFFTVEVERATITRALPYAQEPNVLVLKLITKPNVLIELAAPAQVHGPLHRTQSATRLAFYAQQPEALISQLSRTEAGRSPQQQE